MRNRLDNLDSKKRAQYVAAGAIALITLAWQFFARLHELDHGLANDKARVMQAQLFEGLLNNWNAILTMAAYGILAIGTHLMLSLMAVAVYRGATRLIAPKRTESIISCISFVLLVWLAAGFLNRYLYPLSRALADLDVLMLQPMSLVLIWAVFTAVGVAFICSLIDTLRHRRIWPLLMIPALALLLLPDQAIPKKISTNKQPDIIILGIDSLRPDFLPAYGLQDRSLTPNINQALQDMAVFNDAVTPMGRTFAAYMSLLSGQHPSSNGARFNLFPREMLKPSETIATALQRKGYHTIMAMDESRFANFNKQFGFDQIITPPIGALDFVLGSGFDTIATNLFMSIPKFGELLRYVDGNRAAYYTYNPSTQPARIAEALRSAPQNQPLFLINHLTLPHWPYSPSGLLESRRNYRAIHSQANYEDAPPKYLRALSEVDKQLKKTLDDLRASGRLENSLVIILSDHGEGLGMAKEAIYNQGKKEIKYGHGGFSLSDYSNRIVLAMQMYQDGSPRWRTRQVKGPASLLDVTATIAAVTSVEGSKYEGASLLPWLASSNLPIPDKVRFVESGIRSTGVEKAEVNQAEVANEMAYLYRIEPDLRFEIRPEFLPKHMSMKQRGALRGDIGVSTYPYYEQSKSSLAGCWIKVDYRTRSVNCIDFPAADPQIHSLQLAVCNHFKSDPGFIEEWCKKLGR